MYGERNRPAFWPPNNSSEGTGNSCPELNPGIIVSVAVCSPKLEPITSRAPDECSSVFGLVMLSLLRRFYVAVFFRPLLGLRSHATVHEKRDRRSHKKCSRRQIFHSANWHGPEVRANVNPSSFPIQ